VWSLTTKELQFNGVIAWGQALHNCSFLRLLCNDNDLGALTTIIFALPIISALAEIRTYPQKQSIFGLSTLSEVLYWKFLSMSK
jgi:hypothetical protein